MAHRFAAAPPDDENNQWAADNTVICGLGLGLHETIRYALSTDTLAEEGANPREQNLSALGELAIAGKGGDLIIWHHALPHGSRPNRATLPRFVQYMTMHPADFEHNPNWR